MFVTELSKIEVLLKIKLTSLLNEGIAISKNPPNNKITIKTCFFEKNSNSSTSGRMEELFIEYFLFPYICNTTNMANNSYTCKNIALEIDKLDKEGPIDTLKSAKYKTVGAIAYLMNRVHKKIM